MHVHRGGTAIDTAVIWGLFASVATLLRRAGYTLGFAAHF